MHQYTTTRILGEGAFGEVFEACSKATGNQTCTDGGMRRASSPVLLFEGDVVAIKHIKKSFRSWDECVHLRELQSLKRIKKHVKIVCLKELIREKCDGRYTAATVNRCWAHTNTLPLLPQPVLCVRVCGVGHV